jgi:hypothetical protein
MRSNTAGCETKNEKNGAFFLKNACNGRLTVALRKGHSVNKQALLLDISIVACLFRKATPLGDMFSANYSDLKVLGQFRRLVLSNTVAYYMGT